MRECVHCKGDMRQSTAPFSVDRNGYHVSWDALPAWVCTQCGEPSFAASVVDAIQETLQSIDRTTEGLRAASG